MKGAEPEPSQAERDQQEKDLHEKVHNQSIEWGGGEGGRDSYSRHRDKKRRNGRRDEKTWKNRSKERYGGRKRETGSQKEVYHKLS